MISLPVSPEQIIATKSVEYACSLPDTVHGELRVSDVDSLDASVSRNHASDCRATGRVVTHDKFLEWNLVRGAQQFYDRGWDRVCCVVLVHVHLQAYSLNKLRFNRRLNIFNILLENYIIYFVYIVHFNLMVDLMFISIIRMDRMSHIGWNLETLWNTFLKSISWQILLTLT